jgi:tetratricopeptide (TPR) repeat protein
MSASARGRGLLASILAASMLMLPAGGRAQTLADIAKLEEQGRLEEAWEAASTLATERSEDFAVRLRAGWLGLRTGRHAEAVPHYEAAAALSDGDGLALAGLASALNGCGRHREALEAARRAAAARPEDPVPRLESGFALYHLGRRAEARAEYEAALRLDPGSTAALEGIALAEEPRFHLALHGLGGLGRRVPSCEWSAGAALGLSVEAGRFTPRAAYRFAWLSPVERDGQAQQGRKGSGASGAGAHFGAAGLDWRHESFEIGALAGYAAASPGSWRSPVLAARTAVRFGAVLSLTGVLLVPDGEAAGQIVPRLLVPIGQRFALWAGARVTADGGWHGAGEGGVALGLGGVLVEAAGRFGVAVNPLEYERAALYDYAEDLTWGASLGLGIPVGERAILDLGWEALGTRTTTPEEEELEGMLHLFRIGVQL